MNEQIALVNDLGQTAGLALADLNTIFGKNVPEPTQRPTMALASTENGEFQGSVLERFVADFLDGHTPPITGVERALTRLTDAGFTGKVRLWLLSLAGTDVDDQEPSEFYEMPVFTHTVDPRTYLSAGQTWTNVASIRSSFQQALDYAHTLTFGALGATRKVKFIIPPGVGKLTTSTAQGPINRRSNVGVAQRFPNQLGFGLRPNMLGSISFVGSGGGAAEGSTQLSTIQLSAAARDLFWMDTERVAWENVPGLFRDAPTNSVPAKRPAGPMCWQHYDFVGFAVDNNMVDNLGHVLFGSQPAWNTYQMYISDHNIRYSDIKIYGFKQNPTKADVENVTNSAGIMHRTDHWRSHEATNTTPSGTGPNIWGDWDLDTQTGREAAMAAGWTFHDKIQAYDLEVIDATRGMVVLSTRSELKFNSEWCDNINAYRCSHVQQNPYPSTLTHSSFLFGVNCQGGTARMYDCYSENVADDCFEAGGFSKIKIRGCKNANAILDGILIVYCQERNYSVHVEVTDWEHRIKPNFWSDPALGRRSRAIEMTIEGTAEHQPIDQVTMRNCRYVLDGTAAVAGGVHNSLNRFGRGNRANRYAWQLDFPVQNLVVDGLFTTIKNVVGPSESGATTHDSDMPMVYYRPYPGVVDDNASFKNVNITIDNWDAPASNRIPCRIIGILPATSGSFELGTPGENNGLNLSIKDVAAGTVSGIDAIAIGSGQLNWQYANASGTETRKELFYTGSPKTTNTWPHPSRGLNSEYQRPGGVFSIAEVKATLSGVNGSFVRRGIVVQGRESIQSVHVAGTKPAAAWSPNPITVTTSDIVPNDVNTVAVAGPPPTYWWTQRATARTISVNPNAGKLTTDDVVTPPPPSTFPEDDAWVARSRTDSSQTTAATEGGIPITSYIIRTDGNDPTRVWVPNDAKTKNANPPIVVFFHGASGYYGSMENGGYGNTPELILAQGWIGVSPSFAAVKQADGSYGQQKWTRVAEQDRLRSIVAYVRKTWGTPLSPVIFRATSMGGSLSSLAIGKNLIRNVKGVYAVNAVWNIRSSQFELAHDLGGLPGVPEPGIYAAFNNSTTAMDANNPANLAAVPEQNWNDSGAVYRFRYDSANDNTVDPAQHSVPFRSRLSAAGVSHTYLGHNNGHLSPGDQATDFMSWALELV